MLTGEILYAIFPGRRHVSKAEYPGPGDRLVSRPGVMSSQYS